MNQPYRPFGVKEYNVESPSPLAWWRMKLKQILDIERQKGISEDHIGNLVSIVIIHRPCFMEQRQL